MPGTAELINGGLVTSRDASLLQPGELSDARDVYAMPGSPSLRKTLGRDTFSSNCSNITGLGYANFHSAADRLVVVDGGNYKIATAGDSGLFAVAGNGAGTTLDVVNTDDKAVLLSGGTLNRVLLSDGTARPHGLQPVTTAPGISVTAHGGTWPLGETSVPAFYEYWTTEVHKDGADPTVEGYDEVESTFQGTTTTVNVQFVDSYVTITRPGVVNPNATHWRIYRSDKKTLFFESAFPNGFLIADIPINTTTFSDGLTIPIALTDPSVASSPVSVEGYVTYALWGAFGNAIGNDGLNAVSAPLFRQAVSVGRDQYVSAEQRSRLIVNGFHFAGVGEPVTNIQVQVEGFAGGGAIASVELSWDGGNSWTQPQALQLGTGLTVATINSLFGRIWSGGEFADAFFRVRVTAYGPTNAGTPTVTIDYIQVGLSHSGSTAARVVAFPLIELLVGSERFPRGAYGAPPIATTGDVLQGSILMNDIDNPTHVAWTIPGTVDYCPLEYRAALTSPVNCIRALGNIGLVGCDGNLIRFNFLPVAEDPEFNTGRALDVIDTEEGIVSNRGGCRFVLNGKPMLFFVSQHFLKMTNGYEVVTATDDIIWSEMINSAQTRKTFVENNVEHQELRVYYCGTGSTSINKVLRLSYDATQLKNGKPRVISISSASVVAACSGVLPSGIRSLYTANGASVYIENRGQVGSPSITTREIQLAGPGNSWELDKLGIHHRAGDGTLRASTAANLANEGDTFTPAQETTMNVRCESIMDPSISGEGIRATIEGDNDGKPWEVDYLVLYATEQGDNTALTT
jgi:hypothetical protein